MQTEKREEKRRTLAGEVLEFLLVALAVAAFTFCFLYFTSQSLAETYLTDLGVFLSEGQQRVLWVWLRSLCLMAAAAVFLVLFLFMLGQRIAYLLKIIRGVDALQASRMDAAIPLEGNDELTELAERINYLAVSERELTGREQRLREERDAWIRSLSHDIRTPLTSMISYTQLLESRPELSEEEVRSYIRLVQAKSEQIRELTDRLLGREKQNLEKVEHMKFLMEQLAAEWEEILEERFVCRVDLSGLEDFSGLADIYGFRRIFDNLASNAEKYALPEEAVELRITGEKGDEAGGTLTVCQKNQIRRTGPSPESRGIGLESIRRIAAEYGGTAEVRCGDREFEVEIVMKIPACL